MIPILDAMRTRLKYNQLTLKTFKDALEKRPIEALTWSEMVFNAVAEAEILTRVLAWAQLYEWTEDYV